MLVSKFSVSESSSHIFFWAAAVLRAFFGLASISAVLTSEVPGSLSWVLFVPAADAFLVSIFGGGGSLVPLDVVWVKQALV